MAIIGYLLPVTGTELDHVRAEPASAWPLLHERLDRLRAFGRAVDEGEIPPDDPRLRDLDAAFGVTDLDRSWHPLCFLLRGLGVTRILLNAAEVAGAEEVYAGAGAPRFSTPAQVRDAAAALEEITPDVLIEEFDPRRLQREDIGPDIWDSREEAEEYLRESFEQLARCVRAAAAAGEGLLFYLR